MDSSEAARVIELGRPSQPRRIGIACHPSIAQGPLIESPGFAWPRPEHLMCLDRLGEALQFDGAEIAVLEQIAEELPRRR